MMKIIGGVMIMKTGLMMFGKMWFGDGSGFDWLDDGCDVENCPDCEKSSCNSHKKKVQCECGAESCGSSYHSDYCPKYEKRCENLKKK